MVPCDLTRSAMACINIVSDAVQILKVAQVFQL